MYIFQQVSAGLSGGAVSPGMLSPQQALFMQQQGMAGSRMPFGQQTPGGVLQGPLAYLEKTTSNIGEKTHLIQIKLILGNS